MCQVQPGLNATGPDALQADNRIRAWYMSNMAVGLLYECNLGDIKPDCPVGERAGGQPLSAVDAAHAPSVNCRRAHVMLRHPCGACESMNCKHCSFTAPRLPPPTWRPLT